MKKILNKEGLFILIILAALLLLYVTGTNETEVLKKDGVYVIGRLKEIDRKGGDLGTRFRYEYYYLGKAYHTSISFPLDKAIVNDSALFFQILPNNPGICRQVDDIRVPSCLKNSTNIFWREMPTCY
jgi:hypothetical protein